MSVIGRLLEKIKNFFHKLFHKEKSALEEVNEIIIESKEQLAEIKLNLVEVRKSFLEAEKKLKACDERIIDKEASAKNALLAGNENLARKCLEEKRNLLKTRENIYQVYKQCEENDLRMTQAYNDMVQSVNSLEQRKNNADAKMALAKTKQKINESYQKSRMYQDHSAISEYEEQANREEDIAEAMDELSGNALYRKYDEMYGDDTSLDSVDSELENIRNEMSRKAQR